MLQHKIILGRAEDVLPTFSDKSIDLAILDPPYKEMEEELHSVKKEDYWEWYEGWLNEVYRVLNDRGSLYVFMSQMNMPKAHLIASEIFIEKQIIGWYKPNVMIRVPQLRNYFPKMEYIGFYVKTEKYKWNRLIKKYGIKESCNFIIEPAIYLNSKEGVEHPTQKPLKIIKKFIYASSDEGDLVLDCFLGSGTVSVGSERMNRNSIGVEIKKKFCGLSFNRLKDEVNQMKLGREQSTIERFGF